MDDIIETTGGIEDAIHELLTSNEETAREYLKESFVSSAMLALFHARRDVGLTQTELAQRLHTKQSSIARLERDLSGSVTLRRYVEVALACGMMPLDIALVPTEQLRQYAALDPDAPRAQVAFNAWIASQTQPSLSIVPNSSTNTLSTGPSQIAANSFRFQPAQVSFVAAGSPSAVVTAGELASAAVPNQPTLWGGIQAIAHVGGQVA